MVRSGFKPASDFSPCLLPELPMLSPPFLVAWSCDTLPHLDWALVSFEERAQLSFVDRTDSHIGPASHPLPPKPLAHPSVSLSPNSRPSTQWRLMAKPRLCRIRSWLEAQGTQRRRGRHKQVPSLPPKLISPSQAPGKLGALPRGRDLLPAYNP